MKNYRLLLFLFATIFAPVVASAANVTVNSLPGAVADFHAVFNGNSNSVDYFSTNSGTTGAGFSVVVGKSYDVNKIINGVLTKIGTVSWDASAVATFVPLP